MSTSIVGIAGTHVDQSLSPILHNAAYGEMGLVFEYQIFPLMEVPEGQCQSYFDNFLIEQAAHGVVGMSVTMPFKHNALASRVSTSGSDIVDAIGAANTLSHPVDGIWTAENTDWLGAVASLEEVGIEIQDKRALVLGAGGAGRAVAFGLAERGADKIVIANRGLQRASQLAHELRRHYPQTDFIPTRLSQINDPIVSARGLLEKADIIYNTTSMGQTGTDGENQNPLVAEAMDRIKSGAVVNDAVYMPTGTVLLRAAKERGDLLTIDGTRMLLYQAVEQIRIFTGEQHVPMRAMEQDMYAELVRRNAA